MSIKVVYIDAGTGLEARGVVDAIDPNIVEFPPYSIPLMAAVPGLTLCDPEGITATGTPTYTYTRIGPGDWEISLA